MKTITAAKFKDQCLKIMETIAETKTPVIVTKRGKPVVRVVPYKQSIDSSKTLAGSVLKENGSPFRTGEKWDADLP